MTHPTEQGLLRRIVEDPEDIAARCALADHWEETGNSERAEFVRVQCQIADFSSVKPAFETAKPEFASARERTIDALHSRERKLLDAHWRQWAPPITADGREVCANLVRRYATPSVLFRRGFVEAVTCTLQDWIGEAECHERSLARLAGWTHATCTNGMIVDWQEPDPSERGKTRWVKCPSCHGTGRINAHGPAIVAACPIREVRLTDSTSESLACIAWARAKAGLPPISGAHVRT